MKRWVYTQGGAPLPEPIEVSGDWDDAPRSTGDLGKFEYDNAKTPDGVDISSSSKLKRYLKETGQTLADDYKGEWAQKKEQREAFMRGERPEAQKRESAMRLGREAYRKGIIRF